MAITLWTILFILALLWVTYPKEFPTLIQNPPELLQAIGLETRRRWLMLKIGSVLWFERKQLEFSLWRMKPIIEAERAKQKAQKQNNL